MGWDASIENIAKEAFSWSNLLQEIIVRMTHHHMAQTDTVNSRINITGTIMS